MSTRIIAIDTATEACSVAIYDNGELYSYSEISPREHAQRILPLVARMLAEAGLTLNQLDALAFGQGPGSFTGVRIGIGIAQGLALGADLPMIGVSTLATMAQGAYRISGAKQVLAAIDARMSEVYWAAYQHDEQQQWQLIQRESVLSPQAVDQQMSELSGTWSTVGTGWRTYPDMAKNSHVTLVDGQVELPLAIDMLPFALACWQKGDYVAVEEAQPVYLRNEVTWQKLPGRE